MNQTKTMQATHTPKKIGLMGFFGYGNLGDAALQEAMIQHIRQCIPNAEIYGFSLDPEDTEARHGIKSFQISRTEASDSESSKMLSYKLANWLQSRQSSLLRKLDRWVIRIPMEFKLVREALKNLKGFDALLIAGSGPLNDYWGGGGPLSFPYTLFKWGVVAKLRKTKYLFISVGAGPIDAKLSKTFVRYALSLADYRSYRDEFSKQLITSIGFDKDDPIYPDLAHSLQVNNHAPLNLHETQPIVGIGPMGYFKEECWPEANEFLYADYLDKMAAFIDWLVQKKYSILFLPGEAYFDQLVISDLIEILEEREISGLAEKIMRPSIQTVDDLLSNLSITDYVVASRFHNILLAQSMGRPVLALSYQEKIDDLMEDTGQGNYCLPIGQFTVNELMEKFNLLEANYTAITKQVADKSTAYKLALEEQYEKVFQIIG